MCLHCSAESLLIVNTLQWLSLMYSQLDLFFLLTALSWHCSQSAKSVSIWPRYNGMSRPSALHERFTALNWVDKWGYEAGTDLYSSTTGQNFQQDIQETIYQGMCLVFCATNLKEYCFYELLCTHNPYKRFVQHSIVIFHHFLQCI